MGWADRLRTALAAEEAGPFSAESTRANSANSANSLPRPGRADLLALSALLAEGQIAENSDAGSGMAGREEASRQRRGDALTQPTVAAPVAAQFNRSTAPAERAAIAESDARSAVARITDMAGFWQTVDALRTQRALMDAAAGVRLSALLDDRFEALTGRTLEGGVADTRAERHRAALVVHSRPTGR